MFKGSRYAPYVLDDAGKQEIRIEHLEYSETVLDRWKSEDGQLAKLL